jgi:L-iditol 2-dehydrogenase
MSRLSEHENHDDIVSSVVYRNGRADLLNTPKPAPKSEEVLIEISTAALCLTDIYAAEGLVRCKNGTILGHEFVGRVKDVGQGALANQSGSDINIGDRVACMPYIPCGTCNDCCSNQSWKCNQGKALGINRHGAFTRYVTVPSSQVHTIENSLRDEVNTFAEPVAAALSVLHAPIKRNQTIWVCGKGRIANLCTFVLSQNGYNNVSQGLTPPDSVYDAVVLVQQPCEENTVYEAEELLKNLKSGGVIVLKTRTPEKLFIPINQLIKKRLNIHGVNYAPIKEALQFINENTAFFNAIIGPSFSLEQYEEAFKEARKNQEQKVFFNINSSVFATRRGKS